MTGSLNFEERARQALGDGSLREALGNIQTHLVEGRRRALAEVPDFEALRDAATAVKQESLEHLDVYLEMFESRVRSCGGQVHWASTAAQANEAILRICDRAGARRVVKGKSMVSEEVGLNAHLERARIEAVETDLGEYVIQLRADKPSHIVAPAVHLKRGDFAAAFRAAHKGLETSRDLNDPRDLLAEARAVLRERFASAQVGITGANFLVAETGTAVLVTNEGNAELTMTLPRVHIVLASIDKIVPRLADALVMIRVLARSATGQAASAYVSFATGPARPQDADGPAEFHVVLLDNGRSAMLADDRRDMLRCIRCGACLNHCPVYGAIGGHAYGWVYPGPMGAVLTPSLNGLAKSGDLPQVSTFCGRCDAVCPVRIPLTKLMRGLREQQWDQRAITAQARVWMWVWGYIALHPGLYRIFSSALAAWLQFASRDGRLRRLPFGRAWCEWRDFPAAEGRTFLARWRAGDKCS
jgi:L-lactate dehydrogenase complex protein LldF